MIPKWGWPVGIVVSTACYTVNQGGYGVFSFLAAVVVCRIVVGSQMKDRDEGEKWLGGFLTAFVGTLVYGLVAGMLNPGRVAPSLANE